MQHGTIQVRILGLCSYLVRNLPIFIMAKGSDESGYFPARGSTLNYQFASQVKNYFVDCFVVRTCICSNMSDCEKQSHDL